jgi:hypothetical protein
MRSHSVWLAAALCCASVAVTAQRAAPPAIPALDYYLIHQVHVRSLHGLDSAAESGRMFAATFTADGVYVDESGRAHVGREQLAAAARLDPDQVKGPTNVRHFSSNLSVAPAPFGAAATSSVLIVTGPRQRGRVTYAGQIRDELVRTPDGWRIARRTMVGPGTPSPSHPAPASLAAADPSVRMAPPPFTAAEYAELLQLYAGYTFAWDGVLDEGRQWISLFTPDGSHTNETTTPKQFFFGREELLGFARAMKIRGNRVPETVGHFITNVLLDRTADGAAVKAYRLNVRLAALGEPGGLGSSGIYFDYLVRTPEGWRYRRKNFMAANADVPETARTSTPPER